MTRKRDTVGTRDAPRPHPHTIGWLGTTALAMGGSNQSLFGAKDFLIKPFDATEVVLRIGTLLQTRSLHRQLQQQNALLEEKVRMRTQELEEAELEILARLALAAEYRDDDTGEHTQRVGQMARCLATALGLPAAETALIGRAAPLHDVGRSASPIPFCSSRDGSQTRSWPTCASIRRLVPACWRGAAFPRCSLRRRSP